MSERAVYDTMIFFQWAVLPPDRQHRTIKALYDGLIRLCLSTASMQEVRNVLTRPELARRFTLLTPERVEAVLGEARRWADWFAVPPRRFSLPQHSKDDHLFDLAIEASAKYLVTWESRLLALGPAQTPQAVLLRRFTPQLRILTPPELARELEK